jgi:diaminopimelate epimerase
MGSLKNPALRFALKDTNMEIQFLKLHGCGNDYILIDCLKNPLPDENILSELAQKMCDRHYGVGGEGLILISSSRDHAFKMRIFNTNGLEVAMCANAVCCVGLYAYDTGLEKEKRFKIETGKREIPVEVIDSYNLRIDIGPPYHFASNEELKEWSAKEYTTSLMIDDKEYTITPLSLGNPHVIIFVQDFNLPLHAIGRKIENHSMFTEKTNVEFVRVINSEEIQIRFWERGVGESLAFGDGAGAALVASAINGFSDREVTARLKGGDLFMEWNEDNNHVYITGPAFYIFSGIYYFEERNI